MNLKVLLIFGFRYIEWYPARARIQQSRPWATNLATAFVRLNTLPVPAG